jgi:hypothetical protein
VAGAETGGADFSAGALTELAIQLILLKVRSDVLGKMDTDPLRDSASRRNERIPAIL